MKFQYGYDLEERPNKVYLSPNGSVERLGNARNRMRFAYMFNPRSRGLVRAQKQGCWFAMDNDRFNFSPGKWGADKWLRWLDDMMCYSEKCLFCAVPDVIGDGAATLDEFWKWRAEIADRGYPVALVTQDGMTSGVIPWDHFDALFVGGTDDHKYDGIASSLIEEAIQREKWVHIGRVNSAKRLLEFYRANSWDGTDLVYKYGNAKKYARAVDEAIVMDEYQMRLL